MLVYEKKVENERKLFGSTSNVPTTSDVALTYKNDSDEEITPVLNDTYLDNKKGGIKRASDGEGISVYMGDTCIINSKIAASVAHVNCTLATNFASQSFTAGGDAKEFTYTIVANDDANIRVKASTNFGADYAEKLETFEYDSNGTWTDINGQAFNSDAFALANATNKFRVKFKEAGNYTFTLKLTAVEDGTLMAEVSANVAVTAAEE